MFHLHLHLYFRNIPTHKDFLYHLSILQEKRNLLFFDLILKQKNLYLNYLNHQHLSHLLLPGYNLIRLTTKQLIEYYSAFSSTSSASSSFNPLNIESSALSVIILLSSTSTFILSPSTNLFFKISRAKTSSIFF